MISLYQKPVPVRLRYILGLFFLLFGSIGFVYYYFETQFIAKQLNAANTIVTTPFLPTIANSPESKTSPSPLQQSGKIKLSTAMQAELESLPSIGEVKAKAIIDYRTTHGFKSVNDLQKVKGIGPKTVEKLKPLVEL